MARKFGIGAKVLIVLSAVAITAVAINGYHGYSTAKKSLESESFNKLTAVREMKASQIEDYFQQISDQVKTFSEDRMIIEAVKAFKGGFESIEEELGITKEDFADNDRILRQYYEDEYLSRLQENLSEDVTVEQYWSAKAATRLLQHLYISSSSHEVGSKHLLDKAEDVSNYSKAHEIYHPIIRSYLETFGYYDIFLVDPETGHIVYTVFKEVDFGTSLLTGPYKDTNFARAFIAAKGSQDKDFIQLVDFSPYHPSYNAPAAFISSPIYESDEMIGVLLFQMPIEKINNIMTNKQAWANVGLGQSGETYIVGDDFLLRNQSRFLIEDRENYLSMILQIGLPEETINRISNLDSTIGLQPVKTIGTESALEGETGTRIFPDYRGVSVFSSYKPLNIPGVNWVIMSEIDEAEAFASAYDLRGKLYTWLFVLVIAILVVAAFFARSITQPLKNLTENVVQLDKGNLNVTIDIEGRDEIGVLARAFYSMQNSIRQLIEELKTLNEDLEQKVIDRTKKLSEQKDLMENTIESLTHPFYVVDSNDYTIKLANSTAKKLGKGNVTTCHALTHRTEIPCDSLDDPCPLEEVKKTKKPVVVEHVHFDAEGNSHFCEVHGYPIFDDAGEVSQMIEYSLDITDRKLLEEELKKANERMKGELDIGREIQMSMLPLIFPAFPDKAEFSVHADLHPAREVGGDFYDFFFLNDELFCFCIGDVSDKGVPAALLMAVTKTLIKSRSSDDFSPASVLSHVNDEVSRENKACMFVTVFLGILNIKTGELVYANAGHNPPYILREDRSLKRLDKSHGIVIGAMGGVAYRQDYDMLSSGDILLLYTDGVTEAVDASGNLFSEQRLVELLQSRKYESSEDLVHSVVRTTKEFEGGNVQADDITVMSIGFLGPREGIITDGFGITIKNRPAEIERVTSQFSDFTEKHALNESVRRQVSMAFDELLHNIMTYAYQDEESHDIEVGIELAGDLLTIRISDDGIPFNPFGLKDPDISLSLEDREVGGLGIHLVRNVMDEIAYERRIDRNIVKLIKRIITDENQNNKPGA